MSATWTFDAPDLAATSTTAAAPHAVRPAWIERSDTNAHLLLDVEAAFRPESATRIGIAQNLRIFDPYSANPVDGIVAGVSTAFLAVGEYELVPGIFSHLDYSVGSLVFRRWLLLAATICEVLQAPDCSWNAI